MSDEGAGQIGVIGLAGSGKTTYLSMLPRVISPPWYVNYYGSTQKLVRQASQVLARGGYPHQTDMAALDKYEFKLKKEPERAFLQRGSTVEMTVTISDLAGEHFDFESETRKTDRELFDQYLCQCQGILFLIDPMHQWVKDKEIDRNRYVFLFHDILNSLNSRDSSGDLFVAFCISKFDVFLKEPEVFRRCIPEIGNHRMSLSYKQVQDHLAKCADLKIFEDHNNTIDEINKFCQRPRNHCQWFACSATGWLELSRDEFDMLPDDFKKKHQNNIDKGGITSRGGKRLFAQWYEDSEGPKICSVPSLRPYGLAEPLIWLFTEIAKKN